MSDFVHFDNTQAHEEGWGIFDCDGSDNGRWQLQRVDEDEKFPSDDEAWAHVVAKAHAGSEYHHSALHWIEKNAPIEWRAIAHVHKLNPYYDAEPERNEVNG
jgi:hypothetical protein